MLGMTVLQALLMIGVPVVAGIIAVRRGCPWKLLALGALTFVLSQLVHLPMNAGLGALFGPAGTFPVTGSAALPFQALVAGFTAGLCEEWARYFILRRALRKTPPDAKQGIAHGIGHGGIESVFVGTLAVVTLINMIALRDVETLPNVPPEQMDLIRAQVDTFWSQPPALALVGVAERLMTMVIHLALSLLVFRAVATKQLRLVWIAMAWHWLVDTSAVLGVATFGPEGILWVEGIIALHAITAAWIIRRELRARAATENAANENASNAS
ncbi:MAG: YhfC family glutamic-type intramembrane protease [Myxococcota bacterium]